MKRADFPHVEVLPAGEPRPTPVSDREAILSWVLPTSASDDPEGQSLIYTRQAVLPSLKRVQQSTNGVCAYLSRVLTDFRASCSTALPASENMEGAHRQNWAFFTLKYKFLIFRSHASLKIHIQMAFQVRKAKWTRILPFPYYSCFMK